MKHFSVKLLDIRGSDHFEGITQFIASDDSGSFGILPRHHPLLAVLRYGLARFHDESGIWRYLAIPGGVLRFADAQLTLTTLRYFVGEERECICEQLAKELAQTDSEIHRARATLSEIEHSLVRRLAALTQTEGGGFSL